MEKYQATIRIPFESHEHALIAKESLSVDEELQPQKITKEYLIENNIFILTIYASDLKLLRIAISSFTDMTLVILKTLHEFSSNE